MNRRVPPCGPVYPQKSNDFDAISPTLKRLCSQLVTVPIFNGFACDDVLRLARGVTELKVAKDETLFRRGDHCDGFHLILTGHVKLAIISAEGHEKVVEILRPGQSFGEAVMFMDIPYVVSAQALSESRLLHIAKKTLFDEMAQDPSLCRRIIAGMAQRLHHLLADVESYSLRSGRERVVAFLLAEAARNEIETDPNARQSIFLATRKGVIASRLNLTQEHFSRVLHDLAESGLIDVQGRNIHLLDITRMRKMIT